MVGICNRNLARLPSAVATTTATEFVSSWATERDEEAAGRRKEASTLRAGTSDTSFAAYPTAKSASVS